MFLRAYVRVNEFLNTPNFLEQDEFIACVTPGEKIMSAGNEMIELQIDLDHYSAAPCVVVENTYWKKIEEDNEGRHKFKFTRRPDAPPLTRNITMKL